LVLRLQPGDKRIGRLMQWGEPFGVRDPNGLEVAFRGPPGTPGLNAVRRGALSADETNGFGPEAVQKPPRGRYASRET
jgi:hypothetical protein